MAAKFCTSCGAPLVEGDHFCTSCGEPIDGTTAPPPAVPPPIVPPPDVPPPVLPPPPAPMSPGGPPPITAMPPTAPGPDGAGRSRVPLWVAVGVLAGLVVVLGVLLVVRSDGDGDDQRVAATTTSLPRTTSTTTSTTTTRPPTTTAPPTTAPPATVAPTPDRSEEAIDDVAARMCDTTYITEYTSEEIDTELWRVDVHIVLDSGEWWAHFDVDYATEFGPEIRPADDVSGEMLC